MPDRSFGNAGTAFLAGIRASVHKIAVTATAELLVAGPGGKSRDGRCVWRLDANGAPAPDFGTAGCATLPYDTSRVEGREVLALNEQPDGAVIVAVAYHNFNDAGGLLYRVDARGQADLGYGALGRVGIAGPWPTYPAPMDTAVFLPDRTVLFIGGETDDTFSRRIVRKYWY
jgi:hypothetical protein